MADECTMQRVRSVTGCWTCRLRRKKCDERLPRCAMCASHSLLCHGYGQKPSFMDRGEMEKAERNKLKQILRRNAIQKRAAKLRMVSSPTLSAPTMTSPQSDSPARGSATSIDMEADNTASPLSMAGTSMLDTYDVRSSPQSVSSMTEDNFAAALYSPSWVISNSYLPQTSLSQNEPKEATPYPDNPAHAGNYGATQPQSTQAAESREHEATLLMHYLDRVFPIQYRFYRPSETDDGRGWLLALLTRTNLLYHAALSLSALHLQTLRNIREEGGEGRVEESAELFKHHNLALKELQHYIQLEQQGKDFRGKLQILACTVQFISFELFRGGTSNWQVHLHGAATIASDLISHFIPVSPPGCGDGENTPKATDTAITFMCGVVLWMDTLSTITTSRRSLLFEQQDKLLAVIQMERIIGCRNWVIGCINQISDLGEQKRAACEGNQSMWKFVADAHVLNEHLKLGIREITVEANTLMKRQPFLGTEDYNEYIICVITRVYATAALIYLQIVTWGANSSMPEVRSAVSMAITALKEIPEPQMARSLMWPLVVAGCMASPEEQSFFEDRILGGGRSGLVFGNSSQCLAVIRKCWELRASNTDGMAAPFDWTTAMESLDVHLLCI